MKSLKSVIREFLPVYKCCNTILYELSSTQKKIAMLEQKIADLDSKNEYLFYCLQHQKGESDLETKKRVLMNLPRADGKLRDFQMASNYILQHLKKICDANGLEFFLMGGTLLGAVRHQGFIPWDDDIDIGMMRKDYESLVEILKDDEIVELNAYYGVHGDRHIKVKYRVSDLFFVDVFVFDLVDVNEATCEQYWKYTQDEASEFEKILKERMQGLELLAETIAPKKSAILDSVFDNKMKKFRDDNSCYGHGGYFCESVENPYSCRRKRGLRKVADSFPLIKGKVFFEGKSYDVLRDYEYRLDLFYGDIWRLPQVVRPHHGSEFVGNVGNDICVLKEKGILK